MELRAIIPTKESYRTKYTEDISEVRSKYSRELEQPRKSVGPKTTSATGALSLRHFVSQTQKRPHTITRADSELLGHISAKLLGHHVIPGFRPRLATVSKDDATFVFDNLIANKLPSKKLQPYFP